MTDESEKVKEGIRPYVILAPFYLDQLQARNKRGQHKSDFIQSRKYDTRDDLICTQMSQLTHKMD